MYIGNNDNATKLYIKCIINSKIKFTLISVIDQYLNHIVLERVLFKSMRHNIVLESNIIIQQKY